jgi:hydrogenase maturation protease
LPFETRTGRLIDAMQSGDRIGAVTRFDAGTRPLPSVAFRCSTHAISVGETIELARALDKLPRHVIVYGIEGIQFEAGSAVSPALNQSLEETIERVTCEIQSLHTQLGIN